MPVKYAKCGQIARATGGSGACCLLPRIPRPLMPVACCLMPPPCGERRALNERPYERVIARPVRKLAVAIRIPRPILHFASCILH